MMKNLLLRDVLLSVRQRRTVKGFRPLSDGVLLLNTLLNNSYYAFDEENEQKKSKRARWCQPVFWNESKILAEYWKVQVHAATIIYRLHKVFQAAFFRTFLQD